jgi:hypothetical protein
VCFALVHLAPGDPLVSILPPDASEDLQFLDGGSGSGLFNLAARRLAAQVCSFDHDSQSARKRGALVVAFGLCWAPRWAVAVNAAIYVAARRSVTTLEGLAPPWTPLELSLGPMRVTRSWLGAVYIAEGSVP